jgi:hypothetical protein
VFVFVNTSADSYLPHVILWLCIVMSMQHMCFWHAKRLRDETCLERHKSMSSQRKYVCAISFNEKKQTCSFVHFTRLSKQLPSLLFHNILLPYSTKNFTYPYALS